MYGLAAIQQANGWAMAGAGACIVITGLAVLSFLISLIPRLTGFFEAKAHPPIEAPKAEATPKSIVPEKLPEDIKAASTIYISLTGDLGEAFSLVDLHRKSREVGLPHPHLSINRFRDAGILVSGGEGRFSWQPISE
ncbi:MAG: OadG family protein [Desulfosarcina sp.]|nr:OadG family protein [Desulfosarcina sp.]